MSDSLPPSSTSPKPPHEIMDVSAVAEFLGISKTTVRRLCEGKKLRAIKFGSQWRIREKDVLAMWDQPA